MTRKTIKTIASTSALLLACVAALSACAIQKNEYRTIQNEQWTIDGSGYTKDHLEDAARKGTVTFSFEYRGTAGENGLLLGIPYPYTWIRISENGQLLYEAGSKNRTALCAAPRFVLLNRADSERGQIRIEANIATENGVARPFAAVGSERALLEAAAKKSALRIALSALNILLFAVFTLSLALRKPTRHPSRAIAFGLLNLALALNYILETPLVILYANDYLILNVIEDSSYFFLLPLVFIFITDTLDVRGKLIAIVRAALITEALLATASAALSLTFFSGAFYAATYALSDFLAFGVAVAILVRLAPRALIRKGNDRTIALGVLSFTLCAAYELVMTDFPGLKASSEIATTQIGFIVMVAILGQTAFSRFDRMKWHLDEMATTEKNASSTVPEKRREPGNEGETPNDRRRKKIAASVSLERKIGYLLDTERVWNEDSLTLPQFADLVGAPPHDVTLFINERYGINFNALINGRRLDEAKRLLAETDYTVLRVALEAGFSSKSAFYRFFRESTSISPVEFRSSSREAKN